MPDPAREAFLRKMIAEGTSDDDIVATLKVYDAQHPAASSPSRAGWYQGVVEAAPTIGRAIVNALPAIGGAVGGAVGAAGGTVLGMGVGGVTGAIGGAALGGAAGESARQLTNRALGATAPATSAAAAQDIGLQGAVQGAAQGAGEGLAYGAAKAAPWLMNRALNLTDQLSREFPSLSTTMIDRALTVTKGGLDKARAILRAAKGDANAALTTAHQAGATVPITAATDGLQKTLAEVANSADPEGGLRVLLRMEKNITSGRAGTLTPMEADALKTSLQTQSKALYKAQKMGQGRPNVTVSAQALADMAQSLNTAIGDITTTAGAPGYRAANAEAQEAIGAVRGITKGIRPGANLYQAMVRPGVGAVMGGVTGNEAGGTRGAVAGALIGGALTSPAGMSRLALALTNPGIQALVTQSPRLGAAILQFLQSPPQAPHAATPPAPPPDDQYQSPAAAPAGTVGAAGLQGALQDPYGTAGRGLAAMGGATVEALRPIVQQALPYLSAAWKRIAPYAEQPKNVQWDTLMDALRHDPSIDPVSKRTGIEVLNQIASAGTPVGTVLGMAGLGPAKRAAGVAGAVEGAVEEAVALGKTAVRAGKAAEEGAPLLRSMRNLPDYVVEQTLKEGGVTIHPRTLRGAPEDAVMAGAFPNASARTVIVPEADFSASTVRTFLKKNSDVFDKDPKAYLGIWKDGDQVYLDVAKPFSDVRAATKFAEGQNPGAIALPLTQKQIAAGGARQWTPTGVEREPSGVWPPAQKAVFDTATKSDRPVGNFADFINSKEFQDRLDEMMPIGREAMAGGNWWDITNGPLKRVYGDLIDKVAGMIAITSPQNSPVTNMQSASELIRRIIKNEAMRQPEWRAPLNAMGPAGEGFSAKPGGVFMGETTVAPNAELVAAGRASEVRLDKVNDMYHALLGKARAVIDRHYAKIAEAPERGIFTDTAANRVTGSMDTGKVEAYPLIENAVRTAAKRAGVPLSDYSAWVWEGIRKTIKDTGQLFGQSHRASAIPDTTTGFNEIFTDLVEKKAKHLGISVADLEAKLRSGDAELLAALLGTAATLGGTDPGGVARTLLGIRPAPSAGRLGLPAGGRQ